MLDVVNPVDPVFDWFFSDMFDGLVKSLVKPPRGFLSATNLVDGGVVA